MNEKQGDLVLDYCLDQIGELKFLSSYGITKEEIPNEIEMQLIKAHAESNPDNVECSLILGFKYGFPISTLDVLNKLVECTWHYKHEDIIKVLNNFSSPLSVVPLCNAINLKGQLGYLAYDNYGSYYEKCFRALLSVGGCESIAAIKEFSTQKDPVISEKAKYILDKLSNKK